MKRSAFGAWGAAAAVVLAAASMLGGCTVTSASRAPVEDRISQTVPRVDPSTLPGFENAGKPGYYTVRPGDTLRRIGSEVGQSWSDLARWNNLENPDLIEVGQVLRVVPPKAGSSSPAVVAAPAARPPAAASAPAAADAVPVATQTTPGVAAAAPAAAKPAAAGSGNFAWPASGQVLKKFDGDTNKGLSIGGKAGDPVLAAADGEVDYAEELDSYGKLIIIQHPGDYLTAYAHNSKLLVSRGQKVRKGQKIAEMGSTGTNRVNLYFSMWRAGQLVDPAKHLPAR